MVCRSKDDIFPLAGEDDRCKNEEESYCLSLSFIAWVGTIPVFTTLRKVVVSMGGWWPEGVAEVKMGLTAQ